MNKVLITGITGFFGMTFVDVLKNDMVDCSITGIYNTFENLPAIRPEINAKRIDIREHSKVRDILQKIQPEILIHSAAIRDLEFCAAHPILAEEINCKATKNIAEICQNMGIKLIFISTDMVFDDSEPKFTEKSEPNPVNYYGETKKNAEELVKDILDEDSWLIIRTSRLYGPHPLKRRNDFVQDVAEQLRNNDKLKLPIDEFRNNTYAPWAAKAIIGLCTGQANGIYHICGDECISKYDWGRMIAEEFDLPSELIVPIKMADYTSQVRRPGKVLLDNSKLRAELGAPAMMPSIRETLNFIKNTYNL